MIAAVCSLVISQDAVILIDAAIDKRNEFANQQRLITYIALIETALRETPNGGAALGGAAEIVRSL